MKLSAIAARIGLSILLSCSAGLALADELREDDCIEESTFEDSAVEPVAYDALAQPGDGMESMGMGMTMPAAAPSRSPSRRSGPSGSRQANIRLASVPNMFGDIGMNGGTLFTPGRVDPKDTGFGTNASALTLPTAGGSRRVKIGENNVALPSDRVFFMYNHFHNVYTMRDQPLGSGAPGFIGNSHIDRYTAGIEKMFWDDLWSVEVRMPFNSSYDFEGTGPGASGASGGNIGNLAVILKTLLYTDDATAVGGGVGIDVPTGSDVDAHIGNSLALIFENDAVHVLPWLGFLHNHDDLFFVTGFAQADFATVGNEIRAPQFGRTVGYYNEQNLLYLDLSVGTWLYRDPDAQRLTSVALIGEAHYTTTMQDTDVIATAINGVPFGFTNPYNRQDIVNGTVAIQFEVANTSTLRVACVAPLSDEEDKRLFDSELQIQFNRRF